jgi:hypothetical protein
MSALPAPNPLRRLLVWAGLALIVAVLLLQGRSLLARPDFLPLDDFVEYWAAGHLNALGQNPYDPESVHKLQDDIGRGADFPIMMWNPPWTLSLAMPLGLLPAPLARLLWFIAHLGLLAFCADSLWRLYGGPPRLRWLAWAIAFTFLPTHFLLWSGQIAPFILLGVVAFLFEQRRGRFWLAGAATVLIALVPPLLCNPAVLWQYVDALLHHPPAQWISPTIGSMLRLAFGPEKFWLQFVPPLVGLLWFVPHWLRHRRNWDWAEQMPWLLLASFLTASYGAWPYDLVVLLVPVIEAAARLVRRGQREFLVIAAAGYLGFNVLALAMNLLRFSAEWFLWMTPALLVGYFLCSRGLGPCRIAACGLALEGCQAGTVRCER